MQPVRWWLTGIVRSLGNQGALTNVRVEIETRRFELERADAAARRVASAGPARRGDPSLARTA